MHPEYEKVFYQISDVCKPDASIEQCVHFDSAIIRYARFSSMPFHLCAACLPADAILYPSHMPPVGKHKKLVEKMYCIRCSAQLVTYSYPHKNPAVWCDNPDCLRARESVFAL